MQQFYIISAASGLAAALGAIIFGFGALVALGGGFAAGFGVPRWILSFLKKRRENRFLHVFPDAVDVIVRGIKAGLPLLDCLKMIAVEAPEPVRSEFRIIVDTQTVGIPVGEACVKLFERVPLPEAKFFGIVISIQQKAGGNLSEALGNLSRVLRERKKMKMKIQAMSMEAKASAMIIAALPIAVMLLVYITSPQYISILWSAPLGQMMLAGSAVWIAHRRDGDEEDDQFRFLSAAPAGRQHAGPLSAAADLLFKSASRTQGSSLMIAFVIEKMHDPQFLAMLFAAVAAVATVLTLAMPLLSGDNLNKRLRSVAIERDQMRVRERERMARGEKVALRQTPKQYMKDVVDRFNLAKWVGQEQAREKLLQAGYRGHAPYVTFLFFRMVTPIVVLALALVYLFLVVEMDQPPIVKAGMALFATYMGMQLPYLYLKNKISKAAIVDPAGLPGRARPAADLRRVRHVDRGGVSPRQPGNRLAVGSARRGTDADDC